MFTIRPDLLGIKESFAHASVKLKVPTKLFRTTASKLENINIELGYPLEVINSATRGNCPPALLINTSILENLASTFFTNFSTDS
jgi:hypothetical protein